MTDKQILSQFVALGEFMSQCFSGDVEVVVHDISELSSSAIAIFNNHVTGRDVGGPMTNRGLDFLRKDEFRDKKFVVNYRGVTDKGTVVRSSTFFIRNGRGELIGTLCVNVDINRHIQIKQMMEAFIAMTGESEAETEPEELLESSLSGLITNLIAQHCVTTGRNLDTFSMEDKVDIVAMLYAEGLFQRKGSIGETAELLKISEPSVYRYIKKIKKESGHEHGHHLSAG